MAGQITIKRSPVVLFQTLALIEAAAFIAYLLAVGHGNEKYNFYSQIFLLPNLLSYQTAKLLVLTGVQFFITIYAFFRWYYETYTISPGKLIHRSGVLFKKEKTVQLEKTAALTLSSGPLGKIFHYGSIHVGNSSRSNSIVLSDVSYPAMHLRSLEKARHGQGTILDGNEAVNIDELIGADEHEQLEFKSSLRIDRNQGGVNRDIEKATMKTVAAFLNSKGGNLVLGVNDSHEVLGLEDDYQSLPRKDSDGFENHFTQVFNRTIGPEHRNLVRLQFQSVNNHDVCLVRVAKSSRPVYMKMDDTEYFYVRTGNVTTPLKLSEVETYSRSRWPRRVQLS